MSDTRKDQREPTVAGKRRSTGEPLKPSDVTEHVGWFDRFAGWVSSFTSRAVFFAMCVGLVVIWVPTIFLLEFSVSQLLINTSTTIITFLLVALLQNSQFRTERAIHHKLNAIADALADMIEGVDAEKDASELRKAVGLELIESSGDER
jgi:low affinity Fe/Cu permease